MQLSSNIDRKKVRVKHKIFTWSNFISLTRALAPIPIIYLHYTNGQQITTTITLLVIYIVISDYLDGILARTTNEISELGKTLDPIADKISGSALILYTVYIGRIPLAFILFSIFRDFLIMSGSLYIRHRRGKVPMSVMSGKITVNVMALYWIVAFFAPGAHLAIEILMWCSVAFMIYSFIDYLHRFKQILNGAEFN